MDTDVPVKPTEAFQNPLTKLIHIALFFLALLALFPIDPAILCLLWNWFAVKVGFHSLTYGNAFGLYLLLRFIISPGPPMTLPREKGKKWPDNPKDLWMIAATCYFGRLFTLMVGVVIHLLLSHR